MILKQTRNEKKIHSDKYIFSGSGNVRLVNLSPPQISGCNIDEKYSSWFLIVFFALNVSSCFRLFFEKIIRSNIAELRCQFITQCYSTLAHVQFDIKWNKKKTEKKNFILYSRATFKPPWSGWTDNKWAHARRDCTKQSKTKQNKSTHTHTHNNVATICIKCKKNQHIPSFSRYVNKWNVVHVRRYAYIAYYAVLCRF